MSRIKIRLLIALLSCVPNARGDGEPLLTTAERTAYKATATSAEVEAACRSLAESSKLIHQIEAGRSGENRPIPALVVADPPLETPAEAARSGKLVALLIGNIHAGEVDGKEAFPMLVREVVAQPNHPLLRDLVLIVVPNLNPDGNERVAKDNRPGQVGPEQGMGQRANAAGLDLNRDFMKLESPEIRGLVRLVNAWDPHLVLDAHATNGSHHRYAITYEGPKNPAGDSRVVSFVREQFLPAAGASFEKRSGLNAFFYGNFDRDHERWSTYPAQPRYGTTYFGLRNRIAILSEAFSYAPYKTRVLATKDFATACLEEAAARKAEIKKLLADAREAATKAGREPGGAVAIRAKATAYPGKVDILGFVEREEAGRRVATPEPKNYPCELVQKFEPTASVARPFAYLFPGKFTAAVETLQRHGLEIAELREDIDLDVDVYRIDKLSHSTETYEGRHLSDLSVTPRQETRGVESGTIVVPARQALSALAVYLLEPGSDDGLAAWDFFGEGLAAGSDFPVLRLAHPTGLLTAALRPLPEDRKAPQPITFASLRSGRGMFGLMGNPASPRWLDGEHWLLSKAGKTYRVEARTGKSEIHVDGSPAVLAKALAAMPTIGKEAAEALSGSGGGSPRGPGRSPGFVTDEGRVGALFDHENDLYYARLDGKSAARLTHSPGREELASFSPDGRFVAFVRDNDLFTVDVATQTERALTTGGSDVLRHGKADWVYFEEIYNRNWKGYWWSPDSKRIAFLEYDDAPVPIHTVMNDGATPRRVEPTPYPRAGEPNPKVRLGLVSVAGGDVKWPHVGDYTPGASLISHVGWRRDGKAAYCYVQDRAQTWLDVVSVPIDNAEAPKRLFRDATKAWVENPGSPEFLADGSFLFLSERDGWKHLYRYDADGQLKGRLTRGEWEVRGVERVDEASGWVYFTATRDNPMAVNLYRVKLDGGEIQRLTQGEGSHSPSMSPDGKLFVDSWSDRTTPTRVALFENDGKRVREVDANPVHAIDDYRFGQRGRFTIKARDGFPLEAEVILPPSLDPSKKYPVWLMTYAGPHMPTVSETWGGGRMAEQALASEGVIVFRVDPRSASGKGASATWTAYKRLGVQELEDLKDAVAWLLKEKPFADAARVGIEGHSYGGYMTAFAMTHGDVFAAGIAGAPVTDWRDYDSIYTERYMGLPQDNPDGYDASSVVKAAAKLHGRLLLVHGASDDNVSVRNTLRLVQALQAADKDFEMMIYPSSRHGGFGQHFSRLRVEFIRRVFNLPQPPREKAG